MIYSPFFKNQRQKKKRSVGWRESNPLRFRSPPLPARVCAHFCKATALRQTRTSPHKKFGGRNSFDLQKWKFLYERKPKNEGILTYFKFWGNALWKILFRRRDRFGSCHTNSICRYIYKNTEWKPTPYFLYIFNFFYYFSIFRIYYAFFSICCITKYCNS